MQPSERGAKGSKALVLVPGFRHHELALAPFVISVCGRGTTPRKQPRPN